MGFVNERGGGWISFNCVQLGPIIFGEKILEGFFEVCNFGGKIFEVLVRGLDRSSPGFVTFWREKWKQL